MKGETGFRRIGEQNLSAALPPTALVNVEKYVKTQFSVLYSLCREYQIPIPNPPPNPDVEQPLSAYAQRQLGRKKTKISKRSRAGWITRRGVEQIMADNPGIDKTDALKLYQADNKRTRAEIPTAETAKTIGQKAWVSRLQNIINAAQANGNTMTWVEAHEIALESLRSSDRRRA